MVPIFFAVAFFLILYGLRSLIAGVRNEVKSYWSVFGDTKQLKNLLKENYIKVLNTVIGTIAVLCGILMIVAYFLQ